MLAMLLDVLKENSLKSCHGFQYPASHTAEHIGLFSKTNNSEKKYSFLFALNESVQSLVVECLLLSDSTVKESSYSCHK